MKCLTEGVPFVTGHPSGFEFLVNVDPKKLSLEIPKVSLKSDDLNTEKLESIIGGLEDGVTNVANCSLRFGVGSLSPKQKPNPNSLAFARNDLV